MIRQNEKKGKSVKLIMPKALMIVLCAAFMAIMFSLNVMNDRQMAQEELSRTLDLMKEQCVILGHFQSIEHEKKEDSRDVKIFLNGYKMNLGGNFLITDDVDVYGSSLSTEESRKITEYPIIHIIDRLPQNEKFYKFDYGGKIYYGGKSTSSGFYIYVWYPNASVYQNSRNSLIFCLIICLVLGFIMLFGKNRDSREHLLKLNRQMEEIEKQKKKTFEFQKKLLHTNESLQETIKILDSLKNIYFCGFFVDVKEDRYRTIFMAPWLNKLASQAETFSQLVRDFVRGAALQEDQERLMHVVSLDYIKEALKRESLSEVRQSYSAEYRSIRDGMIKWCRVSVIVVDLDEGGFPDHVIVVLQDITDYKEQEAVYQKKIIEAADEARRASEAKSEFLRRMSHDIRTPINGIQGMVRIAEHYSDDLDKQKECLKKIYDASGYLLDLVNDVLDMTKLESGKINIEEQAFNLDELLSEMNAIIDAQAMEKGVNYEIEPTDRTCVDLIGSPLHLRQILLNIAGNAVKYNHYGGYLKVGTREVCRDDQHIVYQFTCEDNGQGMSEEFQKHMFEPFSQENSDARTKYQGTGLGLSIVRELVELMQGTIEVSSSQGEGTKFTVTLPFKIGRSDTGTEKKAAEVNANCLKGQKILLVEDNDLNMEIADFMLKNEGADVVQAWNGKEAVEIFEASKEKEFDFILMDIMMPQMDGITATKKIRSMMRNDAETIPIIAMTANTFSDDVDRCLKIGMNDYIAKPIQIDEFRKKISSFLRTP